MSVTRLVVGMLWVVLVILGAGTAFSQAYPNKPVRIVTSPVGGNADTVARLVATGISAPLGQPVIVENKPSNLTAETVAKALPDGYTLLFTGGSVWIAPFLQKVNYDPLKDLAPVTLAASTPDILVVHPSLPVNSVKELIALAKTKPGGLNYSMSGIGGSAHLSSELLKSLAGINIVGVAYKGGDLTTNAVISGEVQVCFIGAFSAAPHIKSGKLKALAIASEQPSPRYPGLPTVVASLPGFEPVSEIAFFVTAKTPGAVINQLNREIVRSLNQPDVKERLFNAGLDIIGSSPEVMLATMKSQMAKMGKVIKDAGIRVD